MAGLCGPRILLVWAGIIGLVYTNQQPPANTTPMITTTTPDKPAPPTTAPPTMAPPKTARPKTARPTTARPTTARPTTAHPKTPYTKTAYPKTASANTTPDTKKATGTPPSTPPTPPPQCSYNVIPIPFGLRVEVNSSTAGKFFITLNEEVRTKNTTGMSNFNSLHEFKHLKPCTFYKHNVTFKDNGGQTIICRGTENTTKTSVMRYAEIQNSTDTSGSHCYSSEWDISHSLSTLNRSPKEWYKKGNKMCINITNNDICSDLNITFTSGDCVNSSFHRNEVIGVVFLMVNDIKFTVGKGLPTSIKAELPKNCNNLTIDYICTDGSESKKNDNKNLLDLQPFTKYSCIGHIPISTVEIKKTTSIQIKIDCSLTLIQMKMSAKSSRIDMNWNTSSEECKEIHKLEKFSYNCYCSLQNKIYPGKVNKTSGGGSCVISELEPSTKYICSVQPTYNNKLVGLKSDSNVTTNANNDVLIGILVFLIIITSVALLFVVYKIYLLKSRESHDQNENLMLISATTNEERLLPVEPIAAELLLESYRTKFADEGRLFLDEFQSIPRVFARYTMKEAKKGCNAIKNRYVDILPYDYQRVQLTTGNGEAGSDYINASFIDGYKESKKYIAAQGPKEETVCDFWRMIWEQQSSIIVMVTRCEEGNRVKCAQYWPSSDQKTQLFQEFIVKLSSEDRCPDYTIRHLSLANKREKNSEREVTHIQFLSWPDHGVPEEAHLLLKLRRRVNAFKNFFSGPIVVHCSAGVGRTGTYIAIDAMMECMEAEGKVDIYGYVVKLRKQRCLMVQVEAQYILIHQALLEHNQFGDTEITLPELHNALSMLNQKNSGNEPTLMEDEFERLPTCRSWRTCNTGLREENKKNNRFSSVIPYDYNRVMVKNHEGPSHDSDPSEQEEDEDETSDEEDDDTTKYINASHINGYWGPRSFIAAQTPLPNTMGDFCSMVYQKKVSTIVMLSDCSEEDKESDCVYWDKHKKTIGQFEVEVLNTTTSPTFISRNMLIRHDTRKESLSVKHFQFLKWGDRELPEKPQDLTDMIMAVKQSWRSRKSQSSTPVVVHCSDGSSKSGTFCALWNMLDSAENEKLVDVFQLAKTLHMERQGMLLKLEQYQFLYDALEAFYPVQNGEMKAAEDPAADSLLILNETASAEQPASTTSNGQQGAAQPDSAPTATPPVEDSNAPRATVEA